MDIGILLVEDDPALRETITCYLEAKSENTWSIICASDGNAGMQEILAGSYDVILLDISVKSRPISKIVKNGKTKTSCFFA